MACSAVRLSSIHAAAGRSTRHISSVKALLPSRPFMAAMHRPVQPLLLAGEKAPLGHRWVLYAAASSGSGGSSGGIGGGDSSGGGGSGASGDSSEPHPMRLWTLLYAALLAAGGVMAFVKKGSAKSLTSAAGSALILALSARTMVGPQAKSSLAVCLVIAALLSVVMAGRYSRTGKVMPAGVTAGVSLAMSAAYLGSLFG